MGIIDYYWARILEKGGRFASIPLQLFLIWVLSFTCAGIKYLIYCDEDSTFYILTYIPTSRYRWSIRDKYYLPSATSAHPLLCLLLVCCIISTDAKVIRSTKEEFCKTLPQTKFGGEVQFINIVSSREQYDSCKSALSLLFVGYCRDQHEDRTLDLTKTLNTCGRELNKTPGGKTSYVC